jgi:poly(3-hydroxybutyrate) depolymerase
MYPYALYEQAHAVLAPYRAWGGLARSALAMSPLALVAPALARPAEAALEMFERMTRRYAKPSFGIRSATVGTESFAIEERVAWETPFCRLVHFAKVASPGGEAPAQPRLLIAAPLSGHHATLLRHTIETMLAGCDVYVTDWTDARLVPLSAGRFDLDDYVGHVRAMLRRLGPGAHVMGVCQPSVPVLAAVALMEAEGDRCAPLSMTLMAGPIDTRRSPTAVNRLATERGFRWFEDNCIATVPFPNAGAGRRVYPGYAQLAGFVSMHLDRHVEAHRAMFGELARGEDEAAGRRKDFYDEYLSVLDLTAEFYLQTIRSIFVEHDLPLGRMTVRGVPVDPGAIRRCALMTVEGERDDITGLGQTEAAHGLCHAIPGHRRVHHVQPGVGHYGTFSGRRFASEIAPRIQAFVEAAQAGDDLRLAA